MLYIEFSKGSTSGSDAGPSQEEVATSNSETGLASLALNVKEDEVDRLLREEDGKIYRKRNDQLLVLPLRHHFFLFLKC